MSETTTCGDCGEPFESGRTICPSCGWDATIAVTQRQRRSLSQILMNGGWRVVLYGLLLVLPVVGFARLRGTGPGPDLATTLRWLVIGDGGRSAELVTIHRAHEIAAASARYALRNVEAPTFEDGWVEAVGPYATILVRGWIPFLFFGADTGLAPVSVREMYTVDDEDGWGSPYRIVNRILDDQNPWSEDPQIMADLDHGLQTSFFTRGKPDFGSGQWVRLELRSAGQDGAHDTDDDLSLVSYFPSELVIDLGEGVRSFERRMESSYAVGRHYYRIDGNQWDLIDARLLAEFRLETLS